MKGKEPLFFFWKLKLCQNICKYSQILFITRRFGEMEPCCRCNMWQDMLSKCERSEVVYRDAPASKNISLPCWILLKGPMSTFGKSSQPSTSSSTVSHLDSQRLLQDNLATSCDKLSSSNCFICQQEIKYRWIFVRTSTSDIFVRYIKEVSLM